ncbi:class B sortase [Lachnospiraceae bacterium 54-53]
MNLEKKIRKFQKNYKQGKYRNFMRNGAFGVAIACGAFLCGYYLQGGQAEAGINKLREIKAEGEKAESGSVGRSMDGILPQYVELAAENPDFIGWLTIDGTSVDYPVMWTPEEPEYYSRRGFDKKKSNNGLLFMDEASNLYDYGGNVIIYGHNMKNGSMFADLMNYTDENYWAEHPSIQLDTLQETRIYEIAAVAASDDPDELPFAFVRSEDEAEAETALDNMRTGSLYDTGVEMKYGDDFLTLSTCDYSAETGRMVVIARRIQ